MAEYFTHIAEGSGDKTGQLLQTSGATVSGIVIGLAVCPYYALTLLIYLPVGTLFMKCFQKVVVKNVMLKFKMNAKLGGFTEEMLSALKLIVSFGKEDLKLQEYSKIADESYQAARRSAVYNGVMHGMFAAVIIGFSLYSWTVGFFFIRAGVMNPYKDRPINTTDIVTTYQSMMFGMFTVLSIQNLLPAILRALSVGKTVIEVIDREPKIASPKNAHDRVTQIDIREGIKF